jgi:hypothetical protein
VLINDDGAVVVDDGVLGLARVPEIAGDADQVQAPIVLAVYECEAARRVSPYLTCTSCGRLFLRRSFQCDCGTIIDREVGEAWLREQLSAAGSLLGPDAVSAWSSVNRRLLPLSFSTPVPPPLATAGPDREARHVTRRNDAGGDVCLSEQWEYPATGIRECL